MKTKTPTPKKPPHIIFENESMLIIDKPAFFDSQSENTHKPTVVKWLKEKYNFSGLVHRLDTVTSGIMVCAKNSSAAQKLTDQLNKGRISRIYLAVVVGKIESNGSISKPVDEKPSTTTYKVVEKFNNATLLEVNLETGRKHQIRKHFSEEGHPLLGDQLYGKKGSQLLFQRAALHSWRMKIDNQMYEAKIPDDFQLLLGRLRKSVRK